MPGPLWLTFRSEIFLPLASNRQILCSSVAQSMPKKNRNCVSNLHLRLLISRPPVVNIAPVLALFGANSPLDVATSHFARAQLPSRRYDAGVQGGTPDEWPSALPQQLIRQHFKGYRVPGQGR